jgi:hypothetical protein
MFILKTLIYLSLAFLVLALPIGRGTLFDAVYDRAAPMLSPTYNGITRTIKSMTDMISDAVSGIFSAAPKKQLDVIKERMSSTNKPAPKSKVDREMEMVLKNIGKNKPEATYTDEERELLRKIIRETQY